MTEEEKKAAEGAAAAAKDAADKAAAAAEKARTEALAKPLSSLPTDLQALVTDPEKFRARLEEAGGSAVKKLLKEHGFGKPEDLKAALDAHKAAEDAKKTELQRATEELTGLRPLKERVTGLEATVAAYAKTEFDALPAEAQKLVTTQAGDDAHGRLKTIAALRESGVLAKMGAPVAPANSRAGGTPPAAAPAGGGKAPRDMSEQEWQEHKRTWAATAAGRAQP